jgi:Arc/MetJ-type ribon-helix-helix transcriptional regulator
MKLSISLPDSDVAFLDQFAKDHGLETRSAAVQQALRIAREASLGAAYEEAWAEWDASGEPKYWDRTTGDGLEGSTHNPASDAEAA